jgi:hypothetical protein
VIEVEESVVVMMAPEAGFTVKGSQVLVAPLLFPSPLYTAFQLNDPAELNV